MVILAAIQSGNKRHGAVAFISYTDSRSTRSRSASLTIPLLQHHHIGRSRGRLFASVSSTDGDTSEKISSATVAVPPSSLVDEDIDEINQDDEYFDKLFDSLVNGTVDGENDKEVDEKVEDDHFKLVDFIEQSVGIQPLEEG